MAQEPDETGTGSFEPSSPTRSFHAPESVTLLVRLLDEYLEQLQTGPSAEHARLVRERLVRDHPELASQLEQCLAGLEFIHRQDASPVPTRLGDFQITREIGRGGMGVVYEAEQISLKRRVALKVLRFGAVADREAMQRFQREAETVAYLHHTNIVPIFAIGNHHDVHYYAMQYIEGQSLAEVGREAVESETRIPSVQVAQWGLQAAEALAHAHHRGVIHRDVKPSNVLLDTDGRVWLTDFGLAKRFDDVTLSIAGALLGTPRYMSPEQASAAFRAVDHRTDIYSLGAMLYELATGRPLFDAATPHGVIAQILHTEPTPPRTLRADLPRDLETIIVRCLAKEPDQRYASAKDLADDLRAFLEERPIHARRPTAAEKARRWARRHRRSLQVAGGTLAASILLMLAAGLAFQHYQESRLGRVALNTVGPRLVAELETHDGVVARLAVPTSEPVSVSAGEYSLHLTAAGLMSDRFPLEIERGKTHVRQVQLRDRLLWPPLQLGKYVIPSLYWTGERTDVILVQQTNPPSLRRIHGGTTEDVWAGPFVLLPENVPAGRSVAEWQNLLKVTDIPAPELLNPAPDLDGDAVPDLVLVAGTSPSVLAVSGAEGTLLWWFRSERMLPEGVSLASLPPYGPHSGRIVAPPAIADVNDDGVDDLVVCAVNESSQVWVEAVSGRSGQSLWFYPVVDQMSSNRPSHHSAQHRWTPRIANTASGRVVVATVGNRLITLAAHTGVPLGEPRPVAGLDHRNGDAPLLVADLDRNGTDEIILGVEHFISAGRHGQWSGVRMIREAQGKHASGWRSVLWSSDAVEPPVFDRLLAGPDINRDGWHDVFATALGRDPVEGTAALVVALSGKDGSVLWRRSLAAEFTYADQLGAPLLLWGHSDTGSPRLLVPLARGADGQPVVHVLSAMNGDVLHAMPDVARPRVGDLDGDGLDDVVHTRWELTASQAVNRVVAIAGQTPEAWKRLGVWDPMGDLDGDGCTDFVSADEPESLVARSGRDHRVLWRIEADIHGEDSAGPRSAGDLDGDGADDLIALERQTHCDNAMGGGSMSYRPRTVISAWSGLDGRRLWSTNDFGMTPGGASGLVGGTWQYAYPALRVIDLDDDGRAEICAMHSASNDTIRLTVVSGRNGHVWWTTPVILGGVAALPAVYREPPPDLDGDGVRDLMLWVPLTPQGGAGRIDLRAVSGRTGEVIWSMDAAAPAVGPVNDMYRVLWPEPAVGDIDGDGRAEIVVTLVDATPGRGGHSQLIVLEGRSGQLRWSWGWKGTRQLLPPLFVDAEGSEPGKVCIGVGPWPPKSGGQAGMSEMQPNDLPAVVVLDANGSEVQRIPLTSPTADPLVTLWRVSDVDDDGAAELIFYDAGHVHAYRPGHEGPLWSWPLPEQQPEPSYTALVAELVECPPSASGRPAELAIWTGRRVYGIDGATGTSRWRCDVAWSPGKGFSSPPVLRLVATAAGGLPGVLCHWRSHQTDDWCTSIRQSWPVDPAGRHVVPAASSHSP